ncbi:aminopeptidase P N-terminal domain-containing protein [Pseudoteredinibacter isoporae]|uniref:Xaa-Pro aminopeptidase n=1 Tax=Pseudoteredinibacter isoporae TaxID=570281 RepID=A0A7X0JS42_9GAMM|nr:aminopeptidase P N-terminal domain-containing protein [Pseudoteredinibacter isoporae]MBB6520405.1 Xaa-Pro aminopeptidase [Pseudoteredinibacter isoporae]NHO85973.1 M24 family metallopeptidase [Pseudoteredinibacter isoporae]NIB25575.1 M24 family metallopeptidase [Pseudoteredinibacter isoporae]
MTINYQKRRDILLSEIEADSAVILVGNTEKVRNKNITYNFRQDNDFYYLTGFAEPDAVAVLRPDSEQPFVLFNLPKDEAAEINFGHRCGQKMAGELYGSDAAYDIAELEERLPALLEQRQHIYLSDELGRFEDRIFSWLNRQRRSVKFDETKVFRSLHSVLPYIHERRIIKDEAELARIRQAVNASVDGHKTVMKQAKPGVNEQQLAGAFFGKVSEYGCQDVGYPTILASGNNACCLHYTENNDELQDGQILLIDAGGDYQYYTADITRSFPVNGTFNNTQKAVYEIVLAALDNAIAQVKPGNPWNRLYETAMETLAQGLIDLGILNCSFEEAMTKELYKPYSIHKTGHWMGLDVHDVGRYKNNGEWKTLQANMVFTIEPGLYFPAHDNSVAPEFRGMGIRIEDDILVTVDGHENLSAGAPRTVEEIEAWMAS